MLHPKTFIRRILERHLGLEVRRKQPLQFPFGLDEEDRRLIQVVMDEQLSMVSFEALCTTALACRHVLREGIPGAFVECGVWRGGNGLIAASAFDRAGQRERGIFLYDTFSGMTRPSEIDGATALREYLDADRETHNAWCYEDLENVQRTFARFELLGAVHLVPGDVRTTLKEDRIPDCVSVLRLDTDWYETTAVEMAALFPRLSKGGILIIDDYDAWPGARAAVDEYFREHPPFPYLQPVAGKGRIGIRT